MDTNSADILESKKSTGCCEFIVMDNDNIDSLKPQACDIKANKIGVLIKRIRSGRGILNEKRKKVLSYILYVLGFIGFVIYFGFAMSDEFGETPSYETSSPNKELMWLVIIVVFALLILFCKRVYSDKMKVSDKLRISLLNNNLYSLFRKWSRTGLVILGITAAIIAILVNNPNVIIIRPICFIILLLSIIFITSEHPEYVLWQMVFSGLLTQFFLGYIVLRTDRGKSVVEYISGKIASFIKHSESGANFVFGSMNEQKSVALIVFPLIIYFSAIISILYYYNIIQYAIAFLASCLCFLLGTSAAETVNSAANIFLGLSEAPILIKPFMKHMTDSELFVVMAGGFASIAGSVFGAIIEFKIQKEHLLTACLMGAPGALALSKLSFPEIFKSKITIKSIREYKTEEKYINCLDAILSGARIALSICAAIMAALIAMISILSFADSICVWIFSMFGRKHIDFQYILSYFFYPMVWMLGISHYDSLTAGRLFGLKTFVNEFKAFSDLGNIISTRDLILNNGTNSSCQLHNSSFILLDDKSVVVMTYALCGFSNISSIAIVLGSLSVLAPTKTHVFNKYVVKALLIAIATNLITACFASCLYVPTTDSTLLDICPGFRN